MLMAQATCPSCGAPLALGAGQLHAICAYCNASLLIEAASAGTEPALRHQAVPPDEIERVKQLVLDGRRGEAIAHYARAAAVPPVAAEVAVDQLMVPELRRLLRRAPLNTFGLCLGFGMISVSALGVAWGTHRVIAGALGYALLVAFSGFVLTWHVLWLGPKAVSTWVAGRGVEARARVLRRTLLRPGFRPNGSVVLILFEVQPPQGGPSFLDEEVLLIHDQSLAKLEPGNVIRARYSEPHRSRVFPVAPIIVVGR